MSISESDYSDDDFSDEEGDLTDDDYWDIEEDINGKFLYNQFHTWFIIFESHIFSLVLFKLEN